MVPDEEPVPPGLLGPPRQHGDLARIGELAEIGHADAVAQAGRGRGAAHVATAGCTLTGTPEYRAIPVSGSACWWLVSTLTLACSWP